MTFTWDITSGFTDLGRVRFYLSDTIEAAPMFSDEEINALIAEAGGWQGAVILALRFLIAQLISTPDFQADWLKVDVNKAVVQYKALLAEYAALWSTVIDEDDGSMVGSESLPVWRSDSDATGVSYE